MAVGMILQVLDCFSKQSEEITSVVQTCSQGSEYT